MEQIMKTYKMIYRQRVYKNDAFPGQFIQHFGEDEPKQEWPDGTSPTPAQVSEDEWVQVERTVTPKKP